MDLNYKRQVNDNEWQWTPCVICDRDQVRFIYPKRYYGSRSKGLKALQFYTVMCKNCGLIYTNPRYTLSNYIKLYDSYPDLRIVVDVVPHKYSLFGLNRKLYINSYLNLVGKDFFKGKVLDFICRDGIFLQEMKRYIKSELHGFEFRPEFAELARRKGIKIFLGSFLDSLEEAHYPDEFFDCIFLRHVLEHFYNPEKVLKEIHRILKSTGALTVEVPNVGSINKLIFGRHWSVFDNPRHLYHFSEKTLSIFFNKLGFNVIKINYLPFHYMTFDSSFIAIIRPQVLNKWARDNPLSIIKGFRNWRVAISRLPLDPFLLASLPSSILGYTTRRADVMLAYVKKKN